MNIDVIPASQDDKLLLRQMMQLYLYDFSEFDDSDLDPRGLFEYPWLDQYWSEPGRHSFVVRVDGRPAGFVLINRHTYLPESEWSISEFFVLRKYRRCGVGRAAACSIFDRFRGKWEVQEIERNLPAQHFWRKVIADYTGGKYSETEWKNEGSKGPMQYFDNRG